MCTLEHTVYTHVHTHTHTCTFVSDLLNLFEQSLNLLIIRMIANYSHSLAPERSDLVCGALNIFLRSACDIHGTSLRARSSINTVSMCYILEWMCYMHEWMCFMYMRVCWFVRMCGPDLSFAYSFVRLAVFIRLLCAIVPRHTFFDAG